MKTTLAILTLLTIVHTDLFARSSNTVWTVDYIVSAGTNSLGVDSETIEKLLDVVAAEFLMKPIQPDRSDVIRIYQAHPDLMVALYATPETNRIVVHTVPMTPKLTMTDTHRRFYSRLETELGKAFQERVNKEPK